MYGQYLSNYASQYRCGFPIVTIWLWPKQNIGLRQSIQDELKSINKRQPAFFANIIQSLGVLSMNGTPLAPLILW